MTASGDSVTAHPVNSGLLALAGVAKQLEAQAAQIQSQNERLQALEANRN